MAKKARWDILRGVTITILLLLLIGRGVFPDRVKLDAISITMILVAAVLALAPLLESAELPGGTKFLFRTKLDAGEKVGSEVQARMYLEGVLAHPEHEWPPFIEIAAEVRADAVEHPGDVIAQIRWALVQSLRQTANHYSDDRMPPHDEPEKLIGFIAKRSHLWPEQVALMKVIWDLTRETPLRGDVTPVDAERILALTDVLNDSFVLGYSLNFNPNENWEEFGLICKYEHCIENMSLPKTSMAEHMAWKENIEERLAQGYFDDFPDRKDFFETILNEPIDPDDFSDNPDTTGACPIFGHYCPGGKSTVEKCVPAKEWQQTFVLDHDPDAE
ncbi:hypothetical protein ACFVWG_35815 [Kribbella sp. NPDC058245]|uniref:hypothetical protein n=1 Tax=Kribbella sp. NPDC058245 TaxID=3346399 RepID=UPI0036F0CEE0